MQIDDYDLAPKLRWIWWTARFLVVTGILLCVFVLPQFVIEIADNRLPFVPTRLNSVGVAFGYGLALFGFILSFWRERIAARFLLASGVVQILWAARSFLDSPPRALLAALVFAILPPLVPGVLLLVLLRKANSKTSPRHGNAAI
jgi:hypothetical protein